MHTKLAGHLPLQDLIANIIDGARTKVAAEEPKKDEKKPNPFMAKADKKDDKKEEKDEAEKKSSVIDYSDPDQVEKLASALESVAEQLSKESADSVTNGGESKQGGEQLPTMGAVGGKQPYKKDGSKKHSVPMSTGLQKAEVGAGTQVPNDHARAPGGGAKQGQIKQSAAEGVMAKIQAAVKPMEKEAELPPAFAANAKKVVAAQDKSKPGAEKPDLGEKGKKDDDKKEEKKDEEKKASAEPVDFILGKLAESTQGGLVLTDDLPANKGTPPNRPGKDMIQSNSAVVNATKAKAKAPQKKLLSQVLTEPALSKGTDSKVHENLRNATKGGVKIAAARALLQKIAAEGCTCSGKGECKYCKMKTAKSKMEKDSNASMGIGAGTPAPTPKPMM